MPIRGGNDCLTGSSIIILVTRGQRQRAAGGCGAVGDRAMLLQDIFRVFQHLPLMLVYLEGRGFAVVSGDHPIEAVVADEIACFDPAARCCRGDGHGGVIGRRVLRTHADVCAVAQFAADDDAYLLTTNIVP